MRQYTLATLRLQTEAATFLLELADPSDQWVDANIRIIREEPFADFRFRDVQSWMNVDDLRSLRDRIRQHMRDVCKGPTDLMEFLHAHAHEESVGGDRYGKHYVPQNLGFTLTLLAGEGKGEGDGGFGVTILINAGLAGKDKSPGFFGFDCAVDFRQAESFCADIERVLTKMVG